MRQWIHKLIDQFDFDFTTAQSQGEKKDLEISEERASLLFLIDAYNKNLLEIKSHPVRKVREILDEFAKELMNPEREDIDKILFRFRQFFSKYRITEYTYVQTTFDDFRSIIWDFIDQLSEDLDEEQVAEEGIQTGLEQLKEAVEANSIDDLKQQSREFIDSYMEYQTKKDSRRSQRLKNAKSNLALVKKKLIEANHNMRLDHLTSAFNRKSFDEQLKQYFRLFRVSKNPVTLIMLDIDHFKKVNDTYGHAIGDFVLVELVKLLQGQFESEGDFVARVGGEEFAIIVPDSDIDAAVEKASACMDRVRNEVFVTEDSQIRFTISMGIAQLQKGEDVEQWMKRADDALYTSKTNGRNKYTLASVKKVTAA